MFQRPMNSSKPHSNLSIPNSLLTENVLCKCKEGIIIVTSMMVELTATKQQAQKTELFLSIPLSHSRSDICLNFKRRIVFRRRANAAPFDTIASTYRIFSNSSAKHKNFKNLPLFPQYFYQFSTESKTTATWKVWTLAL